MICSQCGQQLADDAAFCSKCGNRVILVAPTKLFCMRCGEELTKEVAFCTKCGNRVGQTAQPAPMQPAPAKPAEELVAMPVSIKTGLLKTEMGVLLIGNVRSALIQVGNKRYYEIMKDGNQGGSYFQKVSGMAHAFGSFAAEMTRKPLEATAAENPGSVVIGNEQIKTLRIWREADQNTDGYMDYFTFELATTGGKHKGTLDRGINSIDGRLKNMLGKKLKLW